MGAGCSRGAGGLTVTGSGVIHGISADLRDVSELVPVLTALAALADSPSEFTGIGHMRMHETDRLAALATEIGTLGGDVTEDRRRAADPAEATARRRCGLRQP